MSSLPGYTMESFLIWLYDITVTNHDEANVSAGMAEMLGNVSRRTNLTEEVFATIVEKYEPYREDIEYYLNEFDEETQSWRGYAEVVDMNVPEEVHNEVRLLLRSQGDKQ